MLSHFALYATDAQNTDTAMTHSVCGRMLQHLSVRTETLAVAMVTGSATTGCFISHEYLQPSNGTTVPQREHKRSLESLVTLETETQDRDD
jgi:hypothetical protein